MRVIVTSDWHPDASTAGLSRFDDISKAAGRTVEHAIGIGAAAYVFLGDLITNDPSLDLMIRCLGLAQRIAARLHGAHIPSYWLAGNHDVFEDGLGTTVIDPLDSFPGQARNLYHPEGAFAISKPRLVSLPGEMGKPVKEALFLPFTPLSHTYDPIKTTRDLLEQDDVDPKNVVLVGTHLMLEGIGHGSETSDYPRGRDVFFPIAEMRALFPNAVFTAGHYHRQQVYEGVHIPGSLVQLTRGEWDHRPSFLVLDV